MSTNSYCRGESCGMQLQWVECITRSGKISRMPLDVEPVELELVGIGQEGRMVAMNPEQLKGKFVFIDPFGVEGFVRAAVCGDHGPFYTGHHATCPDADSFRKKR
jgi:hypothetical protein